ncbi:endo-1,4-beta-xylanase [Dyadobacter sp. CY261]|uniref:endo-1,4-beta-xylanase n=1 Tax=Dyadobacter sp. CY261 TaxID=2907203 RepID=UPI001F2FE549|nr:endo-1,4-beta-xylanase [Dyadobacter sp. CY261]MCF0069709.1 endo-1,4-beta-xylanase [Dyadobacter sp. CY261]
MLFKNTIILCGLAAFMQVNAQQAPSVTLKEAAAFPVGFAIDPVRVKNSEPFRRTVLEQADGITATNCMKPSRIARQKGVYDFDQADQLIDFAIANGKRVHGHTFVWYIDSAPGWMKQIRDSTELENALKNYIQAVGTHFKGKVASWDVVNEAFDNKTGAVRQDSVDQDGKTLLNVGGILGKDYVARMFQYAHQADPGALLFYNEYDQEKNAGKLNAVLGMVADFKKRGIPIHGLGLQMHINVNTPDAGIENALKKLAETGLLIHISELDISMNTARTKPFQPTAEQLEKQYRKYKFVADAYKRLVPEKQQFGITTWGIGDADSWIPGFCKCEDYPLPFDKEYRAKKAFAGFAEGLQSK